MITVLTIEKKPLSGTCRFFNKIAFNSLKVTCAKGAGADVRHLEYICRRKKVNWRRISRKAEQGRENLVYGGKDEIDADSGVSLFEPYELRQRLCGNMALEILEIMKEIPKNLRIGIYDPKGDFSDLCECVLNFTSNFTVVTHNKGLYTEQAHRLLEEKGAVLCVCSKASALSRCGLIIAPAVVGESFTPMTKAVMLTCAKPLVPLRCRVYYKYSFSLPREFESLRPQSLQAEMFGAALYSLEGIYQIGSCVPFVCTGSTDTQTTLSLQKYFSECFGT